MMSTFARRLPLALGLLIAVAMLLHGPIAQPPNYHDFADRRALADLPFAADVLSNFAFAAVGLYGLVRLYPQRGHPALAAGWPGYALFLVALVLTAFGSTYYHLAPDNARLLWDRLPIALVCAGLLAAVASESQRARAARRAALLWALVATLSVGWWYYTELQGRGDLRPYLFVQGLPLVAIPLWQGLARAPRADRLAFAAAIALYVLAKIAELNDHAILAATDFVSGHTVKHLLAAASAAVIVARLVARVQAKNATNGSVE
jgi:hypothetical protein